MQIEFCEELQEYTNGIPSIGCTKQTVGDCLEYAFNKFPQLLVFLLGEKGEEAQKTTIQLNEEYLVSPDSVVLKVEPEDTIKIGRDIPDGEDGLGKMIVGAALIAASFIPGVNAALWSTASTFLATTGAALTLGGLSEVIMGQPSLPTFDSASSSSSTYTFSGIKNTTTPGTPINVVYGRHRVGGHILNAYTNVIADDMYLYTQIAKSEGEIEEIEGSTIEFNGRPHYNFEDVALYWRRGTTTQYNEPSIRTPNEGINSGSFPAQTSFSALLVDNSQSITGIDIVIPKWDNSGFSQSSLGAYFGAALLKVWVETVGGTQLGNTVTFDGIMGVTIWDINSNPVFAPEDENLTAVFNWGTPYTDDVVIKAEVYQYATEIISGQGG